MSPRGTFQQQMDSLKLSEESKVKVQRAVAFATRLGLTCTGCTVFPTCDWPPLKGIVFHGRLMAINCPDCLMINGAMIIGMGHPTFREDGLLTFFDEQEELVKMYQHIKQAPVHEVGKGSHWSAEGEAAWRTSLAKYREREGV